VHRLSCEDTFRRLDDYLDRELSEEEMDLVRVHLEECAVCSSEFQFEAGVIDSIRRKLRRIAAPPELIERVWQSLQRAGEEQHGGGK
jgi:anti-sigma factor (TIGR02949 family)